MTKISDAGADMIANMINEEFSRDRSAENPNVGKPKISDERLAEMLAGLEGVTSGPWTNYGGSIRSKHHDERHEVARSDLQWGLNRSGKNADHIARCDPDTMRSILTELQSLRSPQPAGVNVKGLDWKGPDENTAYGEQGGLLYTVMSPNRTPGWRVWVHVKALSAMAGSVGGVIITVKAENRDAAMAAAEADYRQRILSALEPQEEEADRDSVRFLRQFADMYRSGAQGAEMDCDAAQTLALAIDSVLTHPTPVQKEEEGQTAKEAAAGHSLALVAALRNLKHKLEAMPEELRGPFLVKGLAPYAHPAPQSPPAPGVDDAMVERAARVLRRTMHMTPEERARAALTAALVKP